MSIISIKIGFLFSFDLVKYMDMAIEFELKNGEGAGESLTEQPFWLKQCAFHMFIPEHIQNMKIIKKFVYNHHGFY